VVLEAGEEGGGVRQDAAHARQSPGLYLVPLGDLEL
jgi:hypothetical protein